MKLTSIKNVPVIVLSILIFGCQYLTNKYKGLDNEFLRYVGQGKVGAAYDVRVKDGFAFVTNNDGVVIFDVSQPENLKKVGIIDIGSPSFGIDIEQKLIYIAGKNGLTIADITHLENPEILGSINLNSVSSGVRIRDNYAYVASRENGLQIIDVSNPEKLKIIGSFNNGGSGSAVEIAENVVYYADIQDGLEVIDISNPAAPQLIKTMPEARGAWDISVVNSKESVELYIGCHGNGTLFVRFTSDGKFNILGHFNDGGEALGVWFENSHIFVADNYEFEILDVADPRKPIKIIEIDGLSGLHDVYVDGKYIYLADGLKGLIILEYKAH